MTEASTTSTTSAASAASAASTAEATDARVSVRIPGPLRPLAGGSEEVVVTAATVGQALDQVMADHPGLRRHLRTDDGALREHVNVFRNEDDVRYLDGERTALAAGDEMTIVPSIAGG